MKINEITRDEWADMSDAERKVHTDKENDEAEEKQTAKNKQHDSRPLAYRDTNMRKDQ